MSSRCIVQTSTGFSGSGSVDSLFLFTKSTMESWNSFLAIPSTSEHFALEDTFLQDLLQVRGPLDLRVQPVPGPLGFILCAGRTGVILLLPEQGPIPL